jgi:hypothetical protein
VSVVVFPVPQLRTMRRWRGARKAAAKAAAYARRLDELATRQEAAWEQAGVLIETKNPRNYDIAVTLLSDLRALAERRGETAAFTSRFLALRQQHQRKPSLQERFDGPVCPILRRRIWRRTLGALRPSRPAWGRKLMNTTNL